MRLLGQLILILVIGFIGGLMGTQLEWSLFQEERPRSSKEPAQKVVEKTVQVQENEALQRAVSEVAPAVAGITTQTQGGAILRGAGLVVTADGLFVTMADLVPSGSSSSFARSENKINAQILKRDTQGNLALARFDEEHLPTVGFANLSELQPGQRVFLVGRRTEAEFPRVVVNEGVIREKGENRLPTTMREDASLEGSPLFTVSGEVIGLAHIAEDGTVEAVPVDAIRQLIGMAE